MLKKRGFICWIGLESQKVEIRVFQISICSNEETNILEHVMKRSFNKINQCFLNHR
jgi:hypothetical protein